MEPNTICTASQNYLQGITDLLCDISVFTESLSLANQLGITAEEKDALQHVQILAQTGAEILESQTSYVLRSSASSSNDPLVQAGVKPLDLIVCKVILIVHLASHIIQRFHQHCSDEAKFDALYPALMLRRKTHKLQKIYSSIGCQHNRDTKTCPNQKGCPLAAWKIVKTAPNGTCDV